MRKLTSKQIDKIEDKALDLILEMFQKIDDEVPQRMKNSLIAGVILHLTAAYCEFTSLDPAKVDLLFTFLRKAVAEQLAENKINEAQAEAHGTLQ